MARRGLQLDGLDFSLKALLSALGFWYLPWSQGTREAGCALHEQRWCKGPSHLWEGDQEEFCPQAYGVGIEVLRAQVLRASRTWSLCHHVRGGQGDRFSTLWILDWGLNKDGYETHTAQQRQTQKHSTGTLQAAQSARAPAEKDFPANRYKACGGNDALRIHDGQKSHSENHGKIEASQRE